MIKVKTMFKVLVCGGRHLNPYKVANKLDMIINETTRYPDMIIHGDAEGADTGAKLCGIKMGIVDVPFPVFPKDWKQYGRRAGPLRNARMLAEAEPQLVLAFPGGKGTENMVKLAREKDVKVIMIEGKFE